MDLMWRRSGVLTLTLGVAGLAAGLGILGCASPGLPKPPSLHVPAAAKDLTAARIGDTVELRFTAPQRSTDNLPLRDAVLTASVCREVDHQKCESVPSLRRVSFPARDKAGAPERVVLQDKLPAELTAGMPRLLGYRLEFFNATGRSGGQSEAAYAASGPTPHAVDGLRASGARSGVILTWSPDGEGEVLVHRNDTSVTSAVKAAPVKESQGVGALLGSKKTKVEATPGEAWLTVESGVHSQTMLDTTAVADVPYTYSALRRTKVQLGGRTLELRSAESPMVLMVLREVYPPATPTGLAAESGDGAKGYSVDLIWQPVMDAKLAGYNVYREADGQARVKLNVAPVVVPGYQDSTAGRGVRYRYRVTAVDVKGNESGGVETVMEPR